MSNFGLDLLGREILLPGYYSTFTTGQIRGLFVIIWVLFSLRWLIVIPVTTVAGYTNRSG
jgi:uncharacterized membrane protein (DUF373 family)